MKKISLMLITLLVAASMGTVFGVSDVADTYEISHEEEVYPTSAGSPEVPTWRIGSTWSYDQDFWAEGDQGSMHLIEELTYTVTAIEEFEIDGAMIPVYNVSFEGEILGGQGLNDLDGEYTGYAYYRMDNLGFAFDYQDRYLEGRMIIWIRVWTETEMTNDPPLDNYNFPIQLGSHFLADTVSHTVGEKTERQGQQDPVVEPINTISTINRYVEIGESIVPINTNAGTFNSFVITQDESGDDSGESKLYYNGNVQNNVREVIVRSSGADRTRVLKSYNVPHNPNSLSIEPREAAPGDTVTVTGNFPGRASSQFTVSIPMSGFTQDVTTDSNGRFTLDIQAPNQEDTTPSPGIIGNLGVVARLKSNPQDAYQVATLTVIDGPSKPSDPAPADGATGVSATAGVELSASVNHHAGSSMTVRFYDASNDGLIGTATNVASGSRASVTWDDLQFGTTYQWYAVADDGAHTSQSDTWQFTTMGGRTLTVNGVGEGTIEVDGNPESLPFSGTYPDGDSVTIKAIPATGWEFVEWTGAQTSTNEEITVTMNSDKTLTANFDTQLHTLTINMEGEGSTDPEAGVHTYSYGTTADVSAIDSVADWYFSHWDGDVPEDQETDRDISILMDGDKEITVHFDQAKDHFLFMSVEGGGRTEPRAGTHSYWDDEVVSVEAIANDGWFFTHWTGDVPPGEEENLAFTITMDEDKSLKAHFDVYTYDVTIGVDGQGSTDPAPGTYVHPHGAEIAITATPDTGWQFTEWTGDTASIIQGGVNDREITIEITGETDITANFEEGLLAPSDPQPEDGADEVSANPELSVLVQHMGGSTIDVEFYDASNDDPIGTAYDIVSGGRAYVTWSGLANGETYEWYAVARDGDHSLTSDTWEFTTTDTPISTLSINAEGDGFVTIDGTPAAMPYEDTFVQGTVVKLEAVAANGWRFQGWTGDHPFGQQGRTTIDITLDRDKVLTAHFEELTGYILTISVEGEGTTDPEPDTYTYEEVTDVVVNAVPEDGWEFSHWSGDYPTGGRENSNITVIMDRNRVITANFIELNLTPAHFVVEIRGRPTEAYTGKIVTISYIIRNTGESYGEQYVNFTVNGQTVRKFLCLEGLSEYEGEFSWKPEEDGSHTITINTNNHESPIRITVERSANIMDSWPLLVIILVVVVAAVVMVFKYEIKVQEEVAATDKKAQQEDLQDFGDDWEKDFHDLFSKEKLEE